MAALRGALGSTIALFAAPEAAESARRVEEAWAKWRKPKPQGVPNDDDDVI